MAEAASPGSQDSPHSEEQSPHSNLREQDRFLPIANISRIMKKALPANGKIAKDAKETVQECVSEFISFITSEASDKCQREKRKTINGDDLLWAMSTLGFEDYIEPLKAYLLMYREMEKTNYPVQHYQSLAEYEQLLESTVIYLFPMALENCCLGDSKGSSKSGVEQSNKRDSSGLQSVPNVQIQQQMVTMQGGD